LSGIGVWKAAPTGMHCRMFIRVNARPAILTTTRVRMVAHLNILCSVARHK